MFDLDSKDCRDCFGSGHREKRNHWRYLSTYLSYQIKQNLLKPVQKLVQSNSQNSIEDQDNDSGAYKRVTGSNEVYCLECTVTAKKLETQHCCCCEGCCCIDCKCQECCTAGCNIGKTKKSAQREESLEIELAELKTHN